MSGRRRDDLIRRSVVAFCPRCHDDRPLEEVRRLSGYLTETPDGKVWLVRGCPDHGRIVTLYEEDARLLDRLERWTAPTRPCGPDTPGNFAPVPAVYRGGLGEMQNQHTCTLLLDVTDGCNLRCPTCFASASPDRMHHAPVDVVLGVLDARLAREGGRLDVVMLSGGEPTVHPDLGRLLDGVLARYVHRILVNTNGLALAHDDDLLALLRRHRDRVEVYLQFDGMRPDTHRILRGGDLSAVKRRTLERLSEAEVFVTLVMTAMLGVNDDEIGAVIDVALTTPYVGGVAIQPVFGSGRSTGVDPMDHLTHTGVLRRLAGQTNGIVTAADLIALPCSHPHCCSIGYLVRAESGTWRSLVALIGEDELHGHLGLVANRITDRGLRAGFDHLAREAMAGIFSSAASLADPTFRRWFTTVCSRSEGGLGSLVHAVASPRRLRREVGARVKRIMVKPFMSIDTMIEERLLQCCVHVGSVGADQYQCVPFCAAQAWPELTAAKPCRVRTPAASSNPS